MIVNRYRYIEQLSRSRNNGLIKITTGLLRSGKSYLLKKLFCQHPLDERVREGHILVIDTAPYYGIGNAEAVSLVERCKSVCSSWKVRAAQLGITRSEQEMMAPAFA